MQNDDSLVVPFFKTVAEPDPAASEKAGRPIFRNVEMVEVRIAGERNYQPNFPAHSTWRTENGVPITYAMRWPDEYNRFAASKEQVADGTPLSELPFLTEAKRAELRSLKVYTAEALASLDGKNLAAIGAQGREMKNQATAYLENASGSANATAMAAELEALRAEVAAMRQEPQPEPETPDKAKLKDDIEALTGARPRGNPSVETLKEMLADLKVDA
jgi:hypothetical protein